MFVELKYISTLTQNGGEKSEAIVNLRHTSSCNPQLPVTFTVHLVVSQLISHRTDTAERAVGVGTAECTAVVSQGTLIHI